MKDDSLDSSFQTTDIDITMSEATPSPKQAQSDARTMTATKSFRFLELPAEIRNMIYSLVPEAQKPIDIWHRRQRGATPILYSTNTFLFRSISGSADKNILAFLQQIDQSRDHLRHISLEYFSNNSTMRSALNLLKAAKTLKTFELGWCPPAKFDKDSVRKRSRYFNPQKNMNVLLPWLRILQKAREARGEESSALEVIRLQDVPKSHHYQEGRREELCKWSRGLFEKSIQELRKALS
ncbi:hypothetical protein LTR85_010469 [Meristemomyces frigidus]|nr:hypothetical protein LTR85_010469 [Meristemomyces frigidus]